VRETGGVELRDEVGPRGVLDAVGGPEAGRVCLGGVGRVGDGGGVGEGLFGRVVVVDGEGDVVGRVPVFGGDLEGEGCAREGEERVDQGGNVTAFGDGEGTVLFGFVTWGVWLWTCWLVSFGGGEMGGWLGGTVFCEGMFSWGRCVWWMLPSGLLRNNMMLRKTAEATRYSLTRLVAVRTRKKVCTRQHLFARLKWSHVCWAHGIIRVGVMSEFDGLPEGKSPLACQ
jgi:hypothetical protein